MSKPRTFRDYDPGRIALAESALLTIWECLGTLRDHLVLVGGLAPKYLCGETQGPADLPRPATMDVDIGIAVSADPGQQGTLYHALKEQGFEWSSEPESNRFVAVINGVEIYVDFLTEDPERAQFGSISFDLIQVTQLPGINRALASPRVVTVSGADLHGEPRTNQVRVCDVGPFLVLKLRSFAERRENKDAFDVYYTLRNFIDGTEAAVAGFNAERKLDNPAFEAAWSCLQEHFGSEGSPGPVATADFIAGERIGTEPEETAQRRLTIQQEAVDGARLLLGGTHRPT